MTEVRLPGLRSVQRSFRQARSRLQGGIVVLGYHRIADGDDPLGLAVSSGRFAEQMAVVARTTRALCLAEAASALSRGAFPRRAVVVTFDDGYRDTWEEVVPVLEREGVPATVFVTTGGFGKEFWWDEMTRLLMSHRLPRRVDLPIGDRVRSWEFMPNDNGAGRRRAAVELAEALQLLTLGEREASLTVLRASVGDLGSGSGPAPRALTEAEVAHLAASPLIEIGAHTVSHRALAGLSRQEQHSEVLGSRRHLEALTGTRVTSFSYPHGSFSAATLTILQDAGFTAACCSEPDAVRPGCNPFTLPRLWAADVNADAFAACLERWVHA